MKAPNFTKKPKSKKKSKQNVKEHPGRMPREVRVTKLRFYYLCFMECNINEFENIRLQNQINDTISDNVIAYEIFIYIKMYC